MDGIILPCPHCGIFIQVVEQNCKIFRCGVYKDSMQQIDPHMPKAQCDAIVTKIYGCGKPFRLVHDTFEICDYI
jgi:hypothetical protein